MRVVTVDGAAGLNTCGNGIHAFTFDSKRSHRTFIRTTFHPLTVHCQNGRNALSTVAQKMVATMISRVLRIIPGCRKVTAAIVAKLVVPPGPWVHSPAGSVPPTPEAFASKTVAPDEAGM